MTTTTRTRKSKTETAPVVFTSKSAYVRSLLDAGMKVSEIVRKLNSENIEMGYAFAYGIAKRYGKSETAADRKPSARIKFNKESNEVVIRPESGGTITVNVQTGAVKKTAR